MTPNMAWQLLSLQQISTRLSTSLTVFVLALSGMSVTVLTEGWVLILSEQNESPALNSQESLLMFTVFS